MMKRLPRVKRGGRCRVLSREAEGDLPGNLWKFDSIEVPLRIPSLALRAKGETFRRLLTQVWEEDHG